MLLHESPQLHTHRTRRLAGAARDTRPSHTIRIQLAAALARLAHHLAPELPDRPVLRTRAAPN